MAIINTYPSATPKGADLLIGTQVKDDTVEENSTKSFTVDSLGSYIITSTSGITGSGTLNTIAMFTPNGQSIGDSLITQASLGQAINVNTNLTVSDDLTVTGSIETNSSLTVEGISTFNNQALFYDPATFLDTVNINGALYDQNSSSGTAGQVLSSTGTGNVEWDDATDIVSGAVAKLIPFQITASAGGSSTYSADNNIVEIGWTGGNGTYVLNIPSATAIPYRNIRFVTNSTFPNGASDKVQITAQSGETIDGAAFFEISKVYEGVSLWSNGTEWIVIQAKAH
jgi:hypothetical protein